MSISHEPSTLDPRQGGDVVSSALHFILFEGLVRLCPDGSLVAAQAKEISISEDQRTYTFHLRGTKWSNGTAVVAQDFEYAWKQILSPRFPSSNAPLLYPIKNARAAKCGTMPVESIGIYALDDGTLVVELERPTPYFLQLISFCVFFPVHHAIDLNHPNWMDEAGSLFVSNGPFRLNRWKHDHEIVVERNPHYWALDQIALDQINITMIANPHAALALYDNHQLDIIGFGYSPLPSYSFYRNRQQIQTHPVAKTSVICFNVKQYPFHNRHIRKAFAYALNREEIVEHIAHLQASVATELISPSICVEGHCPRFHGHDLDQAISFWNQGLEELGISKESFPSITYRYSHSEQNHQLAQIVQQQWKKVFGIEIQLEPCEYQSFIERLTNRNYDMAQSIWFAQYNDPISIYDRYQYETNPKNYSGWMDPMYAELLEESFLKPIGIERNTIFAALEKIFLDAMPAIPLYHWNDSFMTKDHLIYEQPSIGGCFDVTRIRMKPPL